MENQKSNIAKAINNVMKAVNGIEKNSTVGMGRNTYKGVKDIDVKNAYKKAMQDNGLSILPIGIEDEVKISNWNEVYNGQEKRKQQVFTKVKTTYMLLHTSGESIEIVGYGHGVDSQDKAAGKATTYAMKYALLYTFFAPVGQIDDTDIDHSDDKPVPQKTPVRKSNNAPDEELKKFKALLEQYKPISEDGYTNYVANVKGLYSTGTLSQAVINKWTKEINEKLKKQAA